MGRPTSIKESVPTLVRVLQVLRPWIQKQWPALVRSLIVLLAGVALQLLEPWPLKYVLDTVIAPAVGFDIDASSTPNASGVLVMCALGIVAISGLRASTSTCRPSVSPVSPIAF
ncbi:MAG: hypothetical protein R3B91_23450 [Planctomycetaceae bacterium]